MMISNEKKSRKELILDVAFSFLENPGFSAFSMSELAAKLGISKPAIYRHFENKEALIDAMEDRIVDGIADFLRNVDSKDLGTLKKSLIGLVKYFIENPTHINYYIEKVSQNPNYESILYQKLCERNVSFVAKNRKLYVNGFRSNMEFFAKHIFAGMSLFYFVKVRETLIKKDKTWEKAEDFPENVVDLLLHGLKGTTKIEEPVHPVDISKERREEILNLCRISDNSFPEENRIFTALSAVIEKYRIDGVTVERIASELNMAKSSLYEYFENKNQMIKTLIDKELMLLNTIVNENLIEAKNFTEYILIQMYSELEYFRHRPSLIPISGWLLMTEQKGHQFKRSSEEYEDGYGVWQRKFPERIVSPKLGFPYCPLILTSWAGVLPVAFLVEAKGKNISNEKFMEGFNNMIEFFFNGINTQED